MKTLRLLTFSAIIALFPILSGCGDQTSSQPSQPASANVTTTTNIPIQNATPSAPTTSTNSTNDTSSKSASDTKTASTPAPAVTPTPAPEKQQSTVQIISVTSPAARNSTATLVAKVTPGATAYIEVDYKSGPSKAAGLGAKQADSNGNVSWSWHVGGNTTLGYWPITVSCNGASASTQFQVVH